MQIDKQIKLIKPKTSTELVNTLDELKISKDLRVLILDISDENNFSIDESLIDAVKNFPVPLILTLSNNVKPNLLEIVLASHICIVTDSVEFEINNKKKLEKYVGSKNLNKLNLTKDKINAKTALDLGIVNKIITESKLEKEAIAIAEQISKLAPLAIKSCLKAVNEGLDLELKDGLKMETELFSQIFSTEDMKEGTSAFLEKRKPIFKGK